MINIKCLRCGKEKEVKPNESSDKQYCDNCKLFCRFVIKEENKEIISFTEGKRELQILTEELREITLRMGTYMRHFYQLGELVNQAKYLEERIEHLNKNMIESWNSMLIEDGK